MPTTTERFKHLVDETDRLERWRPIAKEPFPISRESVDSVLLPVLGITDTALTQDVYTLDSLVHQVVENNPLLFRACVFKRRFRFHCQLHFLSR